MCHPIQFKLSDVVIFEIRWIDEPMSINKKLISCDVPLLQNSCRKVEDHTSKRFRYNYRIARRHISTDPVTNAQSFGIIRALIPP